jgi:hypothetical protein
MLLPTWFTGGNITATWEAPIVAHQSCGGAHAWFSSLLDPRDTGHSLLLDFSLGGDGTPCPPPEGPPQNCSLAMLSTNGGRSWSLFDNWSKFSPNEVLPYGNGTFVTLPYGLTVDYRTNTTARGFGQVARIDHATGDYRVLSSFQSTWSVAADAKFGAWPYRLVHSGSVVVLKDGSALTTCYGHGAGTYRKWTTMSSVYFVRSNDWGRTWNALARVPWVPAMGKSADGPGEPSTARLADGRILCIFRSDATQYYWSTYSSDEGATWSVAAPMATPAGVESDAWSVKPRLRVLSSGLVVLAGGRPGECVCGVVVVCLLSANISSPLLSSPLTFYKGIFIWVSSDGGATFHRFNLAAVHNARISDPALRFDMQVVNVSSPFDGRALPEPATSSYTGLAEASDGALVISYDRLSNGWNATRPGCVRVCVCTWVGRFPFCALILLTVFSLTHSFSLSHHLPGAGATAILSSPSECTSLDRNTFIE